MGVSRVLSSKFHAHDVRVHEEEEGERSLAAHCRAVPPDHSDSAGEQVHC